MCPTLLGQAHERNGIFGDFWIEFDKNSPNYAPSLFFFPIKLYFKLFI